MGYYLLYRQGSFLFRERYDDALEAAARSAVLPPSAYSVRLLDFNSAPIQLLDMIESAMNRDDLCPRAPHVCA